MDLCDVVDVRGNRCWWLVAVDQHTDNTVIAPCPSHESQAVAKKIFQHWIPWAGPLDVSVRNSGAKTAANSPWQKGRKGRVEQRIATIKEVAGKTILQHQVAGRSAMSIVSFEVAHTLNQRAGRLGIPATTRVFGQGVNVCGELMEHGEAVLRPKGLDERDEQARRFIISGVAASEAIRRAAAARSRPMKTFEHPLFLSQTLIRQTSGNGNARTISGTRGFDWTSRSK